MVKLYYSPTYCGAASFIAAFAAGVNVECEQVDLTSHQTASGTNFYDVNPKGNVPCLVFHDGTVLNEGAAVLQWIADQVKTQSHRHNLLCDYYTNFHMHCAESG